MIRTNQCNRFCILTFGWTSILTLVTKLCVASIKLSDLCLTEMQWGSPLNLFTLFTLFTLNSFYFQSEQGEQGEQIHWRPPIIRLDSSPKQCVLTFESCSFQLHFRIYLTSCITLLHNMNE